jgi:hypothetical protein
VEKSALPFPAAQKTCSRRSHGTDARTPARRSRRAGGTPNCCTRCPRPARRPASPSGRTHRLPSITCRTLVRAVPCRAGPGRAVRARPRDPRPPSPRAGHVPEPGQAVIVAQAQGVGQQVTDRHPVRELGRKPVHVLARRVVLPQLGALSELCHRRCASCASETAVNRGAPQCWRWSDLVGDTLVADVQIGEWANGGRPRATGRPEHPGQRRMGQPWKAKGDRSVGTPRPAPCGPPCGYAGLLAGLLER